MKFLKQIDLKSITEYFTINPITLETELWTLATNSIESILKIKQKQDIRLCDK